jgi:hypothetical protein
MASLTLKDIPDHVMERLRELADVERRSLNRQAIVLLERALAVEPVSFGKAYRRFHDSHGKSPLESKDLGKLRQREADK